MIMNSEPYPISFESEMSQALVCRYGEEMRQYVFKPDIDVSGLSCLLQIAKTDGTFTENGVEVHTDPDTGECTLVITIPQQATVVKGLNRYSICCYGEVETETHLLYSAEGPLWVDDNLITDDMIASVAEVNGLVFPQDFLTVENLVDIVNYVKAQIIDDQVANNTQTWSSSKIKNSFDSVNNSVVNLSTTINAMKTGFDGVVYPSPAEEVQGSDWLNHNNMTSYEDFLYSVDDDFTYSVNFSVSGYYPNWNNGQPSGNANYSMTKFVSVRGLKSFDFRGVSGNVNSVCFYGQDFTFISGGYNTTHITVPTNAYFMKMGIQTADISTFEIYNMVSFLSEIKASADKVELVIDEIKSSLPFYRDSGSYGIAGSPYAPSDIIAAGTKIVGMDVYCSVAGTLKIGFWKLSDNSYYGEQTFSVVGGLNHLSFIYDIEYNSRIIFNNSNLVRYVSSSTGTSIISVSISDNTVTNAGSLANFGLYATMFYFAPSASQTNVLHVGEGQEFATINSALTKAYTIESISNPITIIVHPGVYEEVLFIQGTHYVSIIGTNRDDCIVKDGSADYNKAPIRISGQCYVANMTFIETAETYSSSYGSGTGKSAWKTDVLAGRYIYDWLGTIMSYAVHCDDATNGEDTICRFENCKMYSEVGPAFGGGMQTKQKIQIVNCELITNIDSEVYQYCATTTGKGSISQGTFLCHGKNSGSQMGLLVKDCTVEANIGRVLYMYVVGTNNDADIKFINTSFWSPALGGMAAYYSFNFADSQINGISHGNNLTFLNKNNLA